MSDPAHRRRTLPIRRWLALALLACFLVPFLVTGLLVFHFAGVGDADEGVEEARSVLLDGRERWDDPAWQAVAQARLAELDADFVLLAGGEETYRSDVDQFVDEDGDQQPRRVEHIVVPGTDRSALLFTEYDTGPPDGIWMAPIVALSALLLTLTVIGWFLGRTVVGPLGATSEAARQIATGDLDVSLPSSQVREVNEVSSALALMSSELRASLEQQAELEHERRMFVGAVAHDLRTPLFSLRGALEGLETGLADTPEKRARYVAIAREKAEALERLISDLFDYTRLEYLDQTPKREPLDLAALMRRLVEGALPQAETKGIDLELVAPSDPCMVRGDEHLLTRAIANLLDNALRFTPPGGTVRVECANGAGDVSFTVRDSGPGIPPQDLPHLFSPLYRGESSRNRNTGGAGLGLTIARRILRAHGGDLTAANHPDGAVFTATLPARALTGLP